MQTTPHSRWPALYCVLLLLLCAIATYPVAEIGIIDDWSYVQSARVLAQTGHIVYNGWATAMLGWQLLLGGLFGKILGPSFTAIRASVLVVALLTAFLIHRTFVRAGVNSRNAMIGTLALVLSPLFLPLAVSFMSEIGGLFCVVVCLYACLRALQAQTDRAVIAWLTFAALSNALGGTVRQIAWLGVLVMFPCAVWLLRRRPRVLPSGGLLYVLSILFIYAALHWFQRQPHSAPEHLFDGFPDHQQRNHLVVQLVSLFLSAALFLLPVLIAFATRVSVRNRRVAAFLTCCGLVWFPAAKFLAFRHPDTFFKLTAPFKGNIVNQLGIEQTFSIKGADPFILSIGSRLFVTLLVILVLGCFFVFLLSNPPTSELTPASAGISQPVSWASLIFLLMPFAIAYVVLLLPRAIRYELYDRYLLLLLPIGLILLLRLYQDRVRQDLPVLSSALVLLFAIYAIAGTHDAFSRYRAQEVAIDELRGAGIPDTSIDGGFEHNAMTQIQKAGFIVDLNVLLAAPEKFKPPPSFPDDCQPTWGSLTPVVVGGYTLAFDPAVCGGLSRFAPVTYRAWLAHRMVRIYIVNTVKPVSGQP